MSAQPRSNRRPAIRLGLLGVLPWLLPWVWVLEVDSCGAAPHLEKEIRGTTIIQGFDVETWLVVVPVLLVVGLTPFAANAVERLGARLLLHVLGLVGAALGGWVAEFALFFTLFATRTATGVGWLVGAIFLGCIVDALLRVAWSAQEWFQARRGRTGFRGS